MAASGYYWLTGWLAGRWLTRKAGARGVCALSELCGRAVRRKLSRNAAKVENRLQTELAASRFRCRCRCRWKAASAASRISLESGCCCCCSDCTKRSTNAVEFFHSPWHCIAVHCIRAKVSHCIYSWAALVKRRLFNLMLCYGACPRAVCVAIGKVAPKVQQLRIWYNISERS